MSLKNFYIERRKVLICFLSLILGVLLGDVVFKIYEDRYLTNNYLNSLFAICIFILVYSLYKNTLFNNICFRFILFFALGFILICLSLLNDKYKVDKLNLLKNDGNNQLYGRVYDIKAERQTVFIYIRCIDSINVELQVKMYSRNEKYNYVNLIDKNISIKRDKIKSLKVLKTSEKKNRYKIHKIIGILKIKKENIVIEKEQEYKSLYRMIFYIKWKFFKKLDDFLEHKEASIIKTILFGEKEEVDGLLKESIQLNGLGHILATSGLHLGLIYIFLYKINSILFLKERDYIILLILWLYCTACFGDSVLRATITITIMILFKKLNRRFDLLSATSIAGILSIFINPYVIFSISFQFSYIAVIVISHLVSIEKRYRREGVNWEVGRCIILPICLQLTLMPLTIYYFGHINIFSLISNILLTSLGSAILIFSFASFIAFLIEELYGITLLFFIFAKISLLLSEIFINWNKYLIKNVSLVFKNINLDALMIIIIYLLLFYILSESTYINFLRKKKRIFEKKK